MNTGDGVKTLTLHKGKGRKSKIQSTLEPVMSAEEFAALHKIDVKPITCPNCGKVFTPNIPWCSKHFRGLRCEEHECGPEFAALIAVPVDPKARSRLKQLYFQAKNFLKK